MDVLRLKAPAKINLTLDVLGRREDGYHELKTIMHEIPLFDLISLRLGTGAPTEVKTNRSFIRPETNIAKKTVDRFFASTNINNPGVRIDIKKVIPVGAGLGGGSADAAAILLALNRYFGAPLSDDGLYALGKELGADVPFCLLGGCALAEGIGERLTPLPALPPCHLLVVKPPFSISTGALFRQLATESIALHPDTKRVADALHAGDLPAVSRGVSNSLLAPASALCPEICDIREALLRAGALGASMSGSGSALFALFDSARAATTARTKFEPRYRDVSLLKINGPR